MQFNLPYSWLKEYIAVPADPQKFANELSLYGATVEKVQHTKHEFSEVYVGEILQIEKHPDADKLQIVTVSLGKDRRVIVCGAPNIKVGQKVPVALPGAVLPGDFRISKREVRGIVSDGMLCSPKELAIHEDHSGILILPNDSLVGAKLSDLGVAEDTILEIEPTSNRPDLASIIGIAREASAILGKKIKDPKATILPSAKPSNLSVNVTDKKRCRRFLALTINGVKIGPSPWWLQERLVRAGIRPINNVVDVTNYVMLEFGHPMHAFDADKVGGKLSIRQARSGEKIIALDGESHELSKDHLVITDAEDRAISIPGIMGGEHTGVTEETKNLILEVASWDKVMIRQMSRDLQLASDASKLFEKGLSTEAPPFTMARAVELATSLAGGKIEGLIDKSNVKYKPRIINFSLSELPRNLGIEMTSSRVADLLTRLGFEVKKGKTKNSLQIIVPFWRDNDVNEQIDIVEEIARLHGYHKFESILPEATFVRGDVSFHREYQLKQKLRALGFTETYSYSLVPEKIIEVCGVELSNSIKVANPLSKDLLYMRPSLLPSLVETIDKNQGYYSEMKVFEMAMVYSLGGKGKGIEGYRTEKLLINGVIQNTEADDETLFRQVKGCVQELLPGKLDWVRGDHEYLFDPGSTAYVNLEGKTVGKIGLLKKSFIKQLGVSNTVAAFELNVLDIVDKLGSSGLQEIAKYPAAKRDLSLVVDVGVRYTDVERVITNASPFVKQVDLFDIYRSKDLGDKKQSFSLHISLARPDRTLESTEVDSALEKISSGLRRELQAEVR
jgi:phenylalanyl-tRNA synthetase beta chain